MQTSDFDPASWLIRTKLRPPMPRPDVVVRPRLLALLRSALSSCRLTVISAPAGYGKTTLLAALPASAPDLKIAWLTLDEGDGEVGRFLRAVVAALRQRFPACGKTALALLDDPRSVSGDPRHVVGALVNDVLESVTATAALVLDDVHTVTNPLALGGLDYFLDRLPPLLHVAVASRHDPPISLARLRARGELAELRLADLQFTPAETSELLNDQFGLGVGAQELEQFQSRTEGWPVGVRLLADSLGRLRSSGERRSVLADRGLPDRHVFDFLADEVLNREDPAARRFLLETSILPELTPRLCEAVTGRADAEGALEDLYRRNLFVVQVDTAGTTFRYHALFAEFLHRRLEQVLRGRVGELHARAARAETMPARAIDHYLAAEQWEVAAAAIERLGRSFLRSGLLGTVARWVRAVPESIRVERPHLALLLGICSLNQGGFGAARGHLGDALRRFDLDGNQAGVAEALGYLVTCCFLQGDFASAAGFIERALRVARDPVSLVQLFMARCWLAYFRGAWPDAAADLERALAVVEESGSDDALAIMAFYTKAELGVLPGSLERIERFARRAAAEVVEPVSPLGVAVDELLAFVNFWRGHLDHALQYCERGLASIERLGGYPYLGLYAAGVGAMVHLARSNYQAADQQLDVLFRLMEQVPMNRLAPGAPLYLRGRSKLFQGDLDGARLALEQMQHATGSQEFPLDQLLQLKLRGRLEMAERRHASAERRLREAAALEERLPVSSMYGSAHVLLALLAYDRNHPEKAVAELAPALAESERTNSPGLILIEGADAVPVLDLAAQRGVRGQYAARLLALMDVRTRVGAVAVPDTGAVLSPRELTIFRLIAAGASNRTIAEQLVIAETTVKSHVTSILTKLNVSTRTQAAARARDLGLVPTPSEHSVTRSGGPGPF